MNMTTGNPYKLLLKFSLPLMLTSILNLGYTLADGAVIGRLLGATAFAAVSATALIYWLIFSTLLGLSQGFAVALAQAFGANDRVRFRRAAGTALTLMALTGAILGISGAVFAKPLLALLNTPPELMDGASTYLIITCAGLILNALNIQLCSTLTSLGDSKSPLIAMILSSILNIALDIPLVSVWGFGIAAVALTTLIAQLAAALYAHMALQKLRDWRIARADLLIDRHQAHILLRLGIPTAFRDAIIAIGGLWVQSAINGFGTFFVAGIALANRLFGLLQITAGAFDCATAVFVAQNFGAQKMDRVKSGMKSASLLMAGAAISSMVIGALCGRPIMGSMILGAGREQILDVAASQLSVIIWGLPFLFALYLFRSAVQAMGNTIIPMFSGLAELFVRLLFAIGLVSIWGEWSVLLAIGAGWPLAMLICLIAYIVRRRQTP